MVTLSIPKEPVHIKEMAQIAQKGETWKADSLFAWLGNSLPKYLWSESKWGNTLKEEGYRWQDFQKILSLHKREIIYWLRDMMTWEDFIKTVIATIEGPGGRMIKEF